MGKLRRFAAILGGSAVVYVVSAACGSDGRSSARRHAGDDASAGGVGASHEAGVQLTGKSGEGGSGQVAPVEAGSASKDGGVLETLRDAVADAAAAIDAIVEDSGSLRDALTDPVGDAVAAGYESGTRLRVRFLGGSDGSKQFAGWFDSDLDTNCGARVAADGATRCLPDTYSAPYFSDSECTSRVAYVQDSPCTITGAKFGAWTETTTCGAATHVAPIEAEIARPATLYARNSAGDCLVPNQQPFCPCKWFSVGAESPASSFVQMSEQVE